ncbi:hypothetical protein ACLB2K_023215 [Fragaria x ananassa]
MQSQINSEEMKIIAEPILFATVSVIGVALLIFVIYMYRRGGVVIGNQNNDQKFEGRVANTDGGMIILSGAGAALATAVVLANGATADVIGGTGGCGGGCGGCGGCEMRTVPAVMFFATVSVFGVVLLIFVIYMYRRGGVVIGSQKRDQQSEGRVANTDGGMIILSGATGAALATAVVIDSGASTAGVNGGTGGCGRGCGGCGGGCGGCGGGCGGCGGGG